MRSKNLPDSLSMTKPKKPNDKPPFVIGFKFNDGSTERMSLADLAYKHLRNYAAMVGSDDAALRHAGELRLREISAILASTENARLWASVVNKSNAAKERPDARIDGEDEIEREFDQLVREGFTPREARGRMRTWGRWSYSTIYRRTAAQKKK